MHRPRLMAAWLLALLAAIGVFAAPASTAKEPDPPGQLVDLQLLAFNDYHGYLETDSNPGPGNVGSDPAGGGEFL